jgi:hypothetical protein
MRCMGQTPRLGAAVQERKETRTRRRPGPSEMEIVMQSAEQGKVLFESSYNMSSRTFRKTAGQYSFNPNNHSRNVAFDT